MEEARKFSSLFALPQGPRRPDAPGAAEYLETFLSGSRVRVERIVSWHHATPQGEWYDQEEDEWCVVLEGRARLSFEGGRGLALGRGESVFLPAHVRHRVEATSAPCVWLAVFGRGLDLCSDPGGNLPEGAANR